MKALRWFTILKNNFTFDDLEDETLYALLNYLVDLELLVHSENDSFRWCGSANNLEGEEQIADIQADLLRKVASLQALSIKLREKFQKRL